MKATIWHNPACGTSRKTLALLEAASAEVQVVRYRDDPPDGATLQRLYARAGLRPLDGVRHKEAGAAALGGATDEMVLTAMAANPTLIERPLVATDKGVRLCRPPERVHKIL